jgi:D-tagatose-1,6-bisphosphate aldolase subunit GatZ/KbaZ
VTALDFFRKLVRLQKRGIAQGIASVCSAHHSVWEAAFLQAAADGLPVLIESTANQVNQYGGYTGMTPETFRSIVFERAAARGFPCERVILGGDHLGPYPWRAEHADVGMKKACDLVSACVRSGYSKLHLDTSMLLGGDLMDWRGGLNPQLAALRQAELAESAERAFAEGHGAKESQPVYVIGTEVPPPGGMVKAEEIASVTRVKDLLETVSLCQEAFHDRGLDDAWTRVCAVVAQPGVEYSNDGVREYERDGASTLCAAAHALPGIILEGHSTDYQQPQHLRSLVEDGVAILKVGPALTFALRECLFALESIERELLAGVANVHLSNLAETLELAMLAEPTHWRSYYNGDERQKRLARMFSFSDRCRYYWAVPALRNSTERLLANLRGVTIPLPLLSQFLPNEYFSLREGRIGSDPEDFLRESVRRVLEYYSRAALGSEHTAHAEL